MLEAHDSEPARKLRLELRERFKAGASRDEVEQAVIAQFGPTIISIPKDRDPRSGISAWLLAALGIAALGIFALGFRWTRQAKIAQQPALAGDVPSDELDAKLDRDLRRFDE